MGTRNKYTAGQFCWVDLATPNVEASKRFYTELLGWTCEDMPIPDGGTYSMARVDGQDVAAIASQPDQQREAGLPPMWNSYVAVASADAAAERTKELSGRVHAGPFDVMDVGRMAILQDPQGAFVMVWEAGRHCGAGLVNAPGALCWNELATGDIDGANGFYSQLFGWEVNRFEGDRPYWTIKNQEASNGGIRELNPGEPPNWSCYFAVADLENALAHAQELGATKLMDIIDMEFAKFVPLRDPQGAVVTLYAGVLEE